MVQARYKSISHKGRDMVNRKETHSYFCAYFIWLYTRIKQNKTYKVERAKGSSGASVWLRLHAQERIMHADRPRSFSSYADSAPMLERVCAVEQCGRGYANASLAQARSVSERLAARLGARVPRRA